MNPEDLEQIVTESIIASKLIADGKAKVPREYITPAQQFINEVANFYNRPDERQDYLKDIREYVAKPFDYSVGDNEAKVREISKSLKIKSFIYAGAAAVTLAAAFTVSGWFGLGTLGFGISALDRYFKAGAFEGALRVAKAEEQLMQKIKADIEKTPLTEFERILLKNEDKIKEYL